MSTRIVPSMESHPLSNPSRNLERQLNSHPRCLFHIYLCVRQSTKPMIKEYT
ncbi:hypothetical protein LINPERPRIM_LOCUS3729 [Linum perenne]